MATPPRLKRASAEQRRAAVRDANTLGDAYRLSPPTVAAVLYALMNRGEWPYRAGDPHGAAVRRELLAAGLVEELGPREVVDRARREGKSVPDSPQAAHAAWTWFFLLEAGTPLDELPPMSFIDLSRIEKLARAARAVAAVNPGGGSK